MGKTSIEWTDHSWPIVNGCRRVSPGCENCYAERLSATRLRQQPKYSGLAYFDDSGERRRGPRWTGETRLWEPHLLMPHRLREHARIFVADMGDLFYEGVSESDILRVFDVIRECSNGYSSALDRLVPAHTFQILTKRAARMRDLMTRLRYDNKESGRGLYFADDPNELSYRPVFHNVWLGVSVEDQKRADERIPELLRTPAALRWVSAEPLLEAVDLRRWLEWNDGGPPWLDWVVVGGESGPGARPFDIAWARAIVEQCRSANVPVFVKQLGAKPRDRNDAGFEGEEPDSWPMDTRTDDVRGESDYQGAPVLVRPGNRKGNDPAEWPEDLRVRQFPEARAP